MGLCRNDWHCITVPLPEQVRIPELRVLQRPKKLLAQVRACRAYPDEQSREERAGGMQLVSITAYSIEKTRAYWVKRLGLLSQSLVYGN